MGTRSSIGHLGTQALKALNHCHIMKRDYIILLSVTDENHLACDKKSFTADSNYFDASCRYQVFPATPRIHHWNSNIRATKLLGDLTIITLHGHLVHVLKIDPRNVSIKFRRMWYLPFLLTLDLSCIVIFCNLLRY